jgi:nardilysin
MTDRKRIKLAQEKHFVLKGSCDKREYRLASLPNGVEALLVKIPEGQSSKAAVSLSVNAGSMHEPDLFGGLAHFVEHCVFLGNSKYPTRNSLDKLLAKHNGYSNAHTELEYTAYYLEVNQEGLSKAMDIFASAFTAPSFDVDMCIAELEAVDSEFHEILNNDDCRIEQMICALSDDSHKYRKFTWGNRSSLLKEGPDALVKAAKNFFDTHYSPERMKLCIVSSFSFERMEKMATVFASIPERDVSSVPLSPLDGISFPINSTKLPLALFMEPVADIHQLILLFQLPAINAFYQSKPVDFISHLIGHEAEGSLISSLRKASLASDLSAGVGTDGYSCNSGMSLFEIKITLTTTGQAQWQRVVNEFVFPYIEVVKQQGIDDRVYAELRQVGQIEFNHSTEDSTKEPIDTAEELAIQMLDHLKIERKHLLIHDYLYADSLDRKQIESFLSFIDAQRAITVLVSSANKHEELQKEPVFGISYSQLRPESSPEGPISSEFVVPPRANPFVPKNLGPEAVTAGTCEKMHAIPSETLEGPGYRIFCFKQIRSQPSHKVDVRVRLNLSPSEDSSITASFVETHLRAAYLMDLLESKLYAAKLVGFQVGISAVPPGKGNDHVGIEVCVNGFQEHVISIIDMILEQALEIPSDHKRFHRVKELVRRSYTNEELHPATNQGSNIRKSVLAPKSFFRAKDKLSCIDRIDSILIKGVCVSVDALMAGSYTETMKTSLSSTLERLTVNESPVERNILSGPVIHVTEELVVVESTLNPQEPTSCLLVYYQISPVFSVELSAITDVLSDLMSEPFFDCLRTEEQLGYSVQCGARYTNGSIGLEFLIQSSSETPANMVKRVEAFIEAFYRSEVEPMDDAEFDDQITALVESLLEPPTSLARESRDLWSEVTENRLLWDVNPQTAREIAKKFKGNKKAVQDAIATCLVRDKRIVVQVNGVGKK